MKRTAVGAACRVCECTQADCRECIEATGRPCWWVEEDLCSACVVEAAAFAMKRRELSTAALAVSVGVTDATIEGVLHDFSIASPAFFSRHDGRWKLSPLGLAKLVVV